MSDTIYPPDWHFTPRSHVNHIVVGDLFPVVPGSSPNGGCANCGDHELVYARRIQRSGPVTWVEGKMFHAVLQSAPCPVCRGDSLGAWLEENCGLLGMELDERPALEIRVAGENPMDGQHESFKVAWSLAAELPDAKSWALFSGDYGTGKTHILVGLVNAARLSKVYAIYTKSEAILSALRSTFDDGSVHSTDDVRLRFERVPVLAVDELDRVKWTEWAGEQLFAILNSRFDARRATYFASNLGPGKLIDKTEPLAALVSRISAGHIVAITGSDKRPAYQPALELEETND